MPATATSARPSLSALYLAFALGLLLGLLRPLVFPPPGPPSFSLPDPPPLDWACPAAVRPVPLPANPPTTPAGDNRSPADCRSMKSVGSSAACAYMRAGAPPPPERLLDELEHLHRAGASVSARLELIES